MTLHSFLPLPLPLPLTLKLGGVFLFLKFGQRGGHEKGGFS